MERLYTVNDVAEMFGVTRAAVYIWMRKGKLGYVVVGEHRRVPQSALDAFVKHVPAQLAA
jgi:excisionase family DNA binding protein